MSITDLTDVPQDINQGVSSAKQTTMLSAIGNPRGDYDDTCQEVTHRRMRDLIATKDVGPFRARGLAPALDALITIFAEIKREQSEVHAGLGTAGMLCARFVRGSTSAISNHSWGTAIDLTLDGVLDRRGDDRVQVGLARIAPIFNRAALALARSLAGKVWLGRGKTTRRRFRSHRRSQDVLYQSPRLSSIEEASPALH